MAAASASMAASKLKYLRKSLLQGDIRRLLLHPFPVAAGASSSSLLQPDSTITAALPMAQSVIGFPFGKGIIDPIYQSPNPINSLSCRSYTPKSNQEDSDQDYDDGDFDDDSGMDEDDSDDFAETDDIDDEEYINHDEDEETPSKKKTKK